MRAVVLEEGRYRLQECEPPACGATDVLIRVAYAGINRADLLQKQGRYDLPEGTPAIPGLEVSGTIAKVGSGVTHLRAGEEICALMRDGAFAEFAAVPSACALSLPQGVSLETGAALAEACCTAWISLVRQADLQPGETALIHGGASGIGSMAVQIAAKALGVKVFATAGSEEKAKLCERIGAARAIRYKQEDFVAVIRDETQGKGVDMILDMVGGSYFSRNLEALASGGRLCLIAFLEGAKVNASLAPLLTKNLSVMGSMLRTRTWREKAGILAEVRDRVWPGLAKGTITPVIDRVFPLAEAQKALERMDQGLNLGKILLKI